MGGIIMTLGNWEHLKKKGINLLNPKENYKGLEIYISLFFDWSTELEISHKYYSHLYNKKNNKKSWSKNKVHRAVNDYIHAFNELGWLDSKVRKQNNPGKNPLEYRATLKPYFEYLNNKGIFLESEKEIIERELNEDNRIWVVLREGSFFESIDNYLKRTIFEEIKNCTLNKTSPTNPRYLRLARLANIFYDKVTLKIILEAVEYMALYYRKDMSEKDSKRFILNIMRPLGIFE